MYHIPPFDAPPGQIQMPRLQQSHQGSRQVDGGRFRFDFPLSFSLSFLFGSNAGVSCSWCQLSYHGQGGCNEAKLQDKVLCCWSWFLAHNPMFSLFLNFLKVCGLGPHASLVLPPTWLLKLPKKVIFNLIWKQTTIQSEQGYVESSLGQPQKPAPSKQIQLSGFSSFVPKPLPLSSSSPLIVFLNPKSGGNQGAKLMQK